MTRCHCVIEKKQKKGAFMTSVVEQIGKDSQIVEFNIVPMWHEIQGEDKRHSSGMQHHIRVAEGTCIIPREVLKQCGLNADHSAKVTVKKIRENGEWTTIVNEENISKVSSLYRQVFRTLEKAWKMFEKELKKPAKKA
jgi:hypothetical protein